MVSLSMPPPTNKMGKPITDLNKGIDEVTQENFFRKVDEELMKVEDFTTSKVKQLRDGLENVEAVTKTNKGKEMAGIKEQIDGIGDEFLKLEKYVNLNFTGFHKILKKHDKNLPNKCKAFYVSRMHGQAWVRGDYSDIVVRLSGVYSTLRGDVSAKEQATDSQGELNTSYTYTYIYIYHTSCHAQYVHVCIPNLTPNNPTPFAYASLYEVNDQVLGVDVGHFQG